jgi:hypothetical protein
MFERELSKTNGEEIETANNVCTNNLMKRKGILVAGLVVLFLCIAILVLVKQQETKLQAPKARREARLAQAPDVTTPMEKPVVTPTPLAPSPAESDTGPLAGKPQTLVKEIAAQVNEKTEKLVQAGKAPPKDEKVVQDPLAREALIFVGLDEDAELYWFAAIQDPTLPTSERQDLIDDLNEEGLPDPKHPTMDDLPLILSRLEIIREIAPSVPEGLDWKESYDDLVNLAALATGGGEPVR